jgi:hypothetical protein
MGGIMKIVKEIQDAIEKLPEDDYVQLRQWFIESDWEKWDKQIEDDYNKGKLDFLIQEVKSDKANKKLREL